MNKKILEEVVTSVEKSLTIDNATNTRHSSYNMALIAFREKLISDKRLSEQVDDWVSVEDRLPESENEPNQTEYDVWITDYRIPDAIFRDGVFMVAIYDHDEVFSHYDKIDNVSYWKFIPQPPNSELKECPFCGGEAEFERTGTNRRSCIVVCTECGARHEGPDEYEQSGESWNTRTPNKNIAEALGEIEDGLLALDRMITTYPQGGIGGGKSNMIENWTITRGKLINVKSILSREGGEG